jgi:hypothetical protein
MQTRFHGVLVTALIVLGPAIGWAQTAPTQSQPSTPATLAAQGTPDPATFSAGQIQRWFEAYTVLQAQDALRLSEAQYGRFVTRLKSLQEARRRHQQARNQILADLRRLTNPQAQAAPADEAQIADRLKALREEDERSGIDLKKSYDAVDETLDVRQQARFRVFEERMEQQKLELLMRARQNARNAARGRGRDGR